LWKQVQIGHFDEVADRNGEHGTGNWKKGDPCYKVAKNLTELCFEEGEISQCQSRIFGGGNI
jgi:hypothetical protein